MRIHVQSSETNFKLHIPNWLVLNQIGLQIAAKTVGTKVDFTLTSTEVKQILKSLKSLKKHPQQYPLVDIQSADGTIVLIEL